MTNIYVDEALAWMRKFPNWSADVHDKDGNHNFYVPTQDLWIVLSELLNE